MIVRALALIFALQFNLRYALEEAPDGSVCFNNCNGHGDCIDYQCYCYHGYHGDDCRTSFVPEGQEIIPILTAGHFNITRKNFTQTVSKHKFLLVGFSSYNCHKCITAEAEYKKLSIELLGMNVPFGRANADNLKTIAREAGAMDLPALVLYHKMKPFAFRGAHSAEAVVAYIRKQIGPAAIPLRNTSAVYNFLTETLTNKAKFTLSTTMVVGFFSDHHEVEEDDYEEYIQAAKDLQSNEDIFFGVCTNPSVATEFKANRFIDRTPSMLLVNDDNVRHSINLDELYNDMGIKEWLMKKSVPLVGELTGNNFPTYEKLMIPMLMLFLDLSDRHDVQHRIEYIGEIGDDAGSGGIGGLLGPGSSSTTSLTADNPDDVSASLMQLQSLGSSVEVSGSDRAMGGKSGGVFNENLMEEFRAAAKEHVDRIAFVFLDGNLYGDKMRSLGLYGGKERLPSMALNTRDGKQIPFPEELPINRDTILQYCADFLSGKLRSVDDTAEMAKRALTAARPVNPRNTVVRQDRLPVPEAQRGVSEQFEDGAPGDTAVVLVTLENFDEV